MNYKYYINEGSFQEKSSEIIQFDGNVIPQLNPVTGTPMETVSYGEILFPVSFQEGQITFNVSFKSVRLETCAGVIINYHNLNGVHSYYRVGISNQFGAYYLDYYDGQTTRRLLTGGTSSLQAEKIYEIRVTLKGSILSFSINDVELFAYSNYYPFNGLGSHGLYVQNGNEAFFSNIVINKNAPKVFCIMKFEKDFEVLYTDVISPQCEKKGLKAIKADEIYASSSIIQDIIREISEAAIIIADITMDNPNVFYELGYAHALNKPTILLADSEKRAQLPFDVSGYRTIFYSNTIGGKREIETHIRKYIENICSVIPILR